MLIFLTKFHFRQTILYWGNKFAQKRYLYSKTKKSELDHWILHIRISLGTKFQLKLTISIFGPNLPKKMYFQSRTGKLDTPIEFCTLELVYNHFHNILIFFDALSNFFSPQVKRCMLFCHKLGIRVASRVAERLMT